MTPRQQTPTTSAAKPTVAPEPLALFVHENDTVNLVLEEFVAILSQEILVNQNSASVALRIVAMDTLVHLRRKLFISWLSEDFMKEVQTLVFNVPAVPDINSDQSYLLNLLVMTAWCVTLRLPSMEGPWPKLGEHLRQSFQDVLPDNGAEVLAKEILDTRTFDPTSVQLYLRTPVVAVLVAVLLNLHHTGIDSILSELSKKS